MRLRDETKPFTAKRRTLQSNLIRNAKRLGAISIKKTRTGVVMASFADSDSGDEFRAYLHRNPPSSWSGGEIYKRNKVVGYGFWIGVI